jgi:hypothetical protein
MKKASDILAKLLDANTRGKAQSYASVFRDWRDVAGLSLADHSRVYEIRHDNLFVEVDHNGWMQMLLLRKARILGNLQRKFPELEIRDIKIRVNPSLRTGPQEAEAPAGQAQTPVGPETTAPPPAGVPPGDLTAAPGEAQLERVLAGVHQESLKRRLRQLFLSSLQSRRGRP